MKQSISLWKISVKEPALKMNPTLASKGPNTMKHY